MLFTLMFLFNRNALDEFDFQKLCCNLNQGQARGYGRITHFLSLPEVGHDFQKATVA